LTIYTLQTRAVGFLFCPGAGFFYKYDPLRNAIGKNNLFPILLSKIAWRVVQKVTRVTSRQYRWRRKRPAKAGGGKYFQSLSLAESMTGDDFPLVRG
jgi:hypothetical protein